MTCPNCLPICATSEAQLALRQRNMAMLPDAQINPCSQCGGTDWATSRETIKEPPPLRWWQRMRPPSYGVLAVGNFATSASTLVMGFVAHELLTIAIDAWLSGFTFAAGIAALQMRDSKVLFDRLTQICNDLIESNQALMENRVRMHVQGMLRDDDDPPLAPKLH